MDGVLETEGGNVFIADTNHDAAPAGPGGGPALSVVWKSGDSVQLSFHPKARVRKKESEFQGVRVFYSAAEIDAPSAATED